MVAPPLLDVHFSVSFIRFPLDLARCPDFSKLAHPSQTLYCQSSRMVQLTLFVQTPTLIFFISLSLVLGYSNQDIDFSLENHWILDHFAYNQDWILIEYYCKQTFQGRDTTRASHTSRL